MAATDLDLDELPGFLLVRAANAVLSRLGARLSGLGLRVSDASILMKIGREGKLTASEIGKALDIHRANMVPIVNRLVAARLIVRDPIDRKSVALRLTAHGIEQLQQIQDIVSDFERELANKAGPDHAAHLVPTLQSLID